MTLESSKISVLLGTLDFSPDVGQKTLIVATSAQEVEDVFKVKHTLIFSDSRRVILEIYQYLFNLQAVSNKSAFCLKIHEELTHQFDFVIQQWRKDIGPGTQVILGNLRTFC